MVRQFADFDAFSLDPPVGGFEMVLTGRESGPWRMAAGRFSRSSVTFGVEGGANVGHARIPASMAVFRVALSGTPPICGGHGLDRSRVAVHGPGAHLFESIRGRCTWANYAVDPAFLAEIRAQAGRPDPLVAAGERRISTVAPRAITAIRRGLAGARKAILRSSGVLEDAPRSASLQREIADAFVSAFSASEPPRPPGVAERRRHALLIAAMEYLGATKNHAVTLSELCDVVRASDRTLTRVFHDAFAISPARYLRLRRLGQVRAHLRRGTPIPSTVTQAALQFGFTELGRFSGDYGRLFGESPSTTLRARGDG